MADLSIDLPVSVAEVARALKDYFDAEPAGGDAYTGSVRFTSGQPLPVRFQVEAAEGGVSRVLVDVDPPPTVPYFGWWFVRPVVRAVNRRALAYADAAL